MARRTRQRRGSVYVLVLVAVLTCSAIVIGGLELVRAKHQKAGFVGDYWQASANAAAGLEMALNEVETSPDWRWSLGDGVWVNGRTMPDGGTVTIEASGVTTDAWDTVTLTAIGTHGGARSICKVSLGLQPSGGPAEIGPAVGPNGMLAWWPLNGSAASWPAEAISGTAGADETYGAGTTYPGALPGPGVLTTPWFWGDSSVALSDAGNLDSVRTIAFWFYADSTTGTQYLVERQDGGSGVGEWAFSLSDGDLVAWFMGTSSLSATNRVAVTAGQWHHVALVAESTRVVLYLDGVAVDATGMAVLNYWSGSNSIPIRVAGLYTGLGGFRYPFTGSVCEVMVFSGAMDASSVAALHAAYSPAGQYRGLADTWDRDLR